MTNKHVREFNASDNIFETSGNVAIKKQSRQGLQNPYKCSPKLDVKVLNEHSNGSLQFSTKSNQNFEKTDSIDDHLTNETEDLHFLTEIEPKKLLKLKNKNKRKNDDSFGDISESQSKMTQINHPYVSQPKKNQNEKKQSANH